VAGSVTPTLLCKHRQANQQYNGGYDKFENTQFWDFCSVTGLAFTILLCKYRWANQQFNGGYSKFEYTQFWDFGSFTGCVTLLICLICDI
jgi:hypothetical protein